MAALPRFHNRTGALVSLSNDNRTAHRNHPTQEFNNGVVLSAESLKDDQVLEVKIDKKVNVRFIYFPENLTFVLACFFDTDRILFFCFCLIFVLCGQ